jgi:glutaminyl-peptide cyclotransferase
VTILDRISMAKMTRLLILAAAGAACSCGPSPQAGGIPEYSYQVIHRYPHDPDAFTEGLIFLNGFLYEGTGGDGKGDIFAR